MKFDESDRDYLQRRKQLSAKYGPRELWSVIDHWPLYCGIANLGRALAIYELVRSTLDVPGHIAEFGSWRGANLLFLTKILRIFDPHSAKVVHCFESFEGLTTFAAEDASGVGIPGQYKGSYEELLDVISLYDGQDEIAIHKGLIQQTLPATLEAQKELSFSFVYCDVDLYEPTMLILKHIHPRLSKGGIFVLDEWNAETFPGETIAVREFLSEHGSSYAIEHVRHARQPNLVLRKRTSE